MVLPPVFLKDNTKHLGRKKFLKIAGSIPILIFVYSTQKHIPYNLDRIASCPFLNKMIKLRRFYHLSGRRDFKF